MYIQAFFLNKEGPVTGLTPTITIIDLSDNSELISDASMTEVGRGAYKYFYTSYDYTKDYCIIMDGGATLLNNERYIFVGNDSFKNDIADQVYEEDYTGHTTSSTFGNLLNTLLNYESGKWEITNNQMKFYNTSGTVIKTFNLYDSAGNPSMMNVYKREPV